MGSACGSGSRILILITYEYIIYTSTPNSEAITNTRKFSAKATGKQEAKDNVGIHVQVRTYVYVLTYERTNVHTYLGL